MKFKRWTPFTFITPVRYVDTDDFWVDFDFPRWSETTYEWIEDPWNGVRDFAKQPRTTVAEGTGDCEDYALVAVSWAFAQNRSGIGLGFCWELPYPWPRHVIAFDDEHVYSSGDIMDASLSEYLDQSKYDYCFRRLIN